MIIILLDVLLHVVDPLLVGGFVLVIVITFELSQVVEIKPKVELVYALAIVLRFYKTLEVVFLLYDH